MQITPPPLEPPPPPPPLPSTSKFPSSLQQVPPKQTVKKEISADKLESNVEEKLIAPSESEKSIQTPPTAQDVDKTADIPIEEKTDAVLEAEKTDIVQVTGKDEPLIIETAPIDSPEPVIIEETTPKEDAASDLEQRPDIMEIESAVSAMNFLIEEAAKYEEMCKTAVKNHSVLVEKVLENAIGKDDDPDDGTWTDVFEAANKKSETLDMAQVSYFNLNYGTRFHLYVYWNQIFI